MSIYCVKIPFLADIFLEKWIEFHSIFLLVNFQLAEIHFLFLRTWLFCFRHFYTKTAKINDGSFVDVEIYTINQTFLEHILVALTFIHSEKHLISRQIALSCVKRNVWSKKLRHAIHPWLCPKVMLAWLKLLFLKSCFYLTWLVLSVFIGCCL